MGNAKPNVEESKRRRRQSRGSGVAADWATVDGEKLRRAIAIVGRSGGALRFGYTRDGGSYAIGVLGDGDPYTEYLRPTDDIDAYLEGIIDRWSDD